jgi:hypothetical protein
MGKQTETSFVPNLHLEKPRLRLNNMFRAHKKRMDLNLVLSSGQPVFQTSYRQKEGFWKGGVGWDKRLGGTENFVRMGYLKLKGPPELERTEGKDIEPRPNTLVFRAVQARPPEFKLHLGSLGACPSFQRLSFLLCKMEITVAPAQGVG